MTDRVTKILREIKSTHRTTDVRRLGEKKENSPSLRPVRISFETQARRDETQTGKKRGLTSFILNWQGTYVVLVHVSDQIREEWGPRKKTDLPIVMLEDREAETR